VDKGRGHQTVKARSKKASFNISKGPRDTQNCRKAAHGLKYSHLESPESSHGSFSESIRGSNLPSMNLAGHVLGFVASDYASTIRKY